MKTKKARILWMALITQCFLLVVDKVYHNCYKNLYKKSVVGKRRCLSYLRILRGVLSDIKEIILTIH